MRDVRESVEWAENELASVGVASPRVDGELLLEHILTMSRSELYLNFGRALGDKQRARFRAMVEKRKRRLPVQHIVGEAPFRALVLRVTPDVLIPRPETEIVAGEAIRLARSLEGARVLDLGTGSGAIALALLSEVEGCSVVAADISGAALAVACENARLLGLQDRIYLVRSDLFQALAGRFERSFDLVVSNPPYVLSADFKRLEPEVSRYEPRLALESGLDDLAFHRRIVEGATRYLKKGGYLIMEISAGSGRRARDLLSRFGRYEDVAILSDLGGRDRVVKARLA